MRAWKNTHEYFVKVIDVFKSVVDGSQILLRGALPIIIYTICQILY
jgi:hypothetical protein